LPKKEGGLGSEKNHANKNSTFKRGDQENNAMRPGRNLLSLEGKLVGYNKGIAIHQGGRGKYRFFGNAQKTVFGDGVSQNNEEGRDKEK